MALGFGPVSGNPVSSDTGSTAPPDPETVSKLVAYAIVNAPETGALAAKLVSYAITGADPVGSSATKLAGYAAVISGGNLDRLQVTKAVAYALVNGGDVIVSKVVSYAALLDSVRATKLTGFALVRAPAAHHSIVFVNT